MESRKKKVYVIGSLRNPSVPMVAAAIRDQTGTEVFDDWFAAGPHADDAWRDYEKSKGNNFIDGLAGKAAKHVFAFDKKHLDASDIAVLVLPAGRSGHLELGYMIGQGKLGIILVDDPERWDVMYQFAGLVTDKLVEVTQRIKDEAAECI